MSPQWKQQLHGGDLCCAELHPSTGCAILKAEERSRRRGSAASFKMEEIPMEASTVYFTDFRCPVGTSLTEKLRRLCLAAGIRNIDMDGRFVAIKMHFG